MELQSLSFGSGESIPRKYTCDGDNISPELQLVDVPTETKSLALVVEDPDSPDGMFTHWFVWNIDPLTHIFPEGSVPDRGIEAVNSFGHKHYGGPCPPPGAAHRYYFRVYALNTMLNFADDADMERILPELESRALAEAEIMGIYSRD